MLQLNNLKTRAGMNATISVFVITVEAIMYLLLYNLYNLCMLEKLQSDRNSITI